MALLLCEFRIIFHFSLDFCNFQTAFSFKQIWKISFYLPNISQNLSRNLLYLLPVSFPPYTHHFGELLANHVPPSIFQSLVLLELWLLTLSRPLPPIGQIDVRVVQLASCRNPNSFRPQSCLGSLSVYPQLSVSRA